MTNHKEEKIVNNKKKKPDIFFCCLHIITQPKTDIVTDTI